MQDSVELVITALSTEKLHIYNLVLVNLRICNKCEDRCGYLEKFLGI